MYQKPNIAKKNHELKNLFQSIAYLLGGKNIQPTWLRLGDHISKNEKSENRFFIRFRTLRNILDQNMKTVFLRVGLHVVD